MKVMFLLDTLETGGSERHVCDLARQLALRADTEVTIVTLYPRFALAHELEGTAVRLVSLGLSWKYALWAGVRRLRALVSEIKPDLVHVHLFPANLVAALALSDRRFRNIPVLFTEHSEWNRRRRSRLLRMMDSWVYRRFARIICVSTRVRCELVQWLPELDAKSVVIPSAVPLPTQSWRSEGPFVTDILFVGRLVRAKGVDLLLEAVSLLKKRYPEVRLTIAGEGAERNVLQALADQLGLAENVQFLGLQNDVQALMQTARVLVIPSRWEGGPLVLLEGMAVGLPTIVTRVGLAEEVVEDELSGFLVIPGDIHGLADALEKALRDPELARQIGARGHERFLLKMATDNSLERLREEYGSAVELSSSASPHNARPAMSH